MWIINHFFDKRKVIFSNSKYPFLAGLTLVIITSVFSFTPHPYHVSYTEINYKKENQNLTFAIEVFTDDLETEIKLLYKPHKFFLGSDSLTDSAQVLIEQYIHLKTSIIIDGIVLKDFKFLPTESNPDRTIIYFELTDLPNFKSLAFYNEILINIFSNQQNIVEFFHSDKHEKALLSRGKTSITWVIE